MPFEYRLARRPPSDLLDTLPRQCSVSADESDGDILGVADDIAGACAVEAYHFVICQMYSAISAGRERPLRVSFFGYQLSSAIDQIIDETPPTGRGNCLREGHTLMSLACSWRKRAQFRSLPPLLAASILFIGIQLHAGRPVRAPPASKSSGRSFAATGRKHQLPPRKALSENSPVETSRTRRRACSSGSLGGEDLPRIKLTS